MKYVEENEPRKHYYLPQIAKRAVEVFYLLCLCMCVCVCVCVWKSFAQMLNSVDDLMIMTNKVICKHLEHVRLIFFHLLVSVISSLFPTTTQVVAHLSFTPSQSPLYHRAKKPREQIRSYLMYAILRCVSEMNSFRLSLRFETINEVKRMR